MYLMHQRHKVLTTNARVLAMPEEEMATNKSDELVHIIAWHSDYSLIVSDFDFFKGIPDETAIITVVDGVLTLKDNLKDYINCGDQLANLNFLDFFLNTYNGDELQTLTTLEASLLMTMFYTWTTQAIENNVESSEQMVMNRCLILLAHNFQGMTSLNF